MLLTVITYKKLHKEFVFPCSLILFSSVTYFVGSLTIIKWVLHMVGKYRIRLLFRISQIILLLSITLHSVCHNQFARHRRAFKQNPSTWFWITVSDCEFCSLDKSWQGNIYLLSSTQIMSWWHTCTACNASQDSHLDNHLDSAIQRERKRGISAERAETTEHSQLGLQLIFDWTNEITL